MEAFTTDFYQFENYACKESFKGQYGQQFEG